MPTWIICALLSALPVLGAEKPIKVYILAGQSNMLEMGDVSGGRTRHLDFYQSAAAYSPKGVEVSVYEGAYDPAANYDTLKPLTTKTVIYDGMGKDPFPKADGAVTYVARGFIEAKTTGIWDFAPGYGGSMDNVTELDGKEVCRKEPGGEAVRNPVKMVSPGNQGYHYNRNSETYMLIGEALGRGMLDLVKGSNE